MAAPIKGSSGTSQMYLYIELWSLDSGLGNPFGLVTSKTEGQRPKTVLPLHQINLIYPDCFLVPIQRDDDP
jgi:hypothetical protein